MSYIDMHQAFAVMAFAVMLGAAMLFPPIHSSRALPIESCSFAVACSSNSLSFPFAVGW
jgi:hypothetical protein